ncbi:MAG: ATP-dependent Clp protease adaptor ClpS [Pirellulales bacterium]|nr:ATP-dependent Clp protease adaptor ClpS [Pirellulales bacterium]
MDEFSNAVVTTTKPRPQHSEPRRKRQPRYHVVLWDSDEHSYDYVIRMLKQLFGHPEEKGFQLADTVDTAGKAVVFTTAREHAEFKRDQVLAFGRDKLSADCKGSMHATVEPVGEDN